MKMKATKKIVGAACALVAATALAAGSTFAWFSSNGTVTAKGMVVDVTTTNSYLIIGNTKAELRPAEGEAYKTNIALTPSTMGTNGTLTTGTATKLLPAAHNPFATESDTDTTGKSTLAASGTGSIVDASSWYTGKGASPTDGTLTGDKDYASVAAAFDSYVVSDEVYVSVAVGSEAVEKVYLDLTVADADATATTKSSKAISVLVLYQQVATMNGDAGTWSYKELTGATSGKSLTEFELPGVSEDSYVIVKLMVYLNGEDPDVKSVNARNIQGLKIDMTLKSEKAGTVTPTEP